MTRSICLYFRVHQPYSLKAYTQQQVGVDHCYEDAAMDEMMIGQLARECYLPANQIILSNILQSKGKFTVSYSISGILLELLQKYRPDVISSFRALVDTGAVEILAETYYHSLSFLHSKKEFDRQLHKHGKMIQELFGTTPSVFRNTELIYNNKLACHINDLGYKGILCEGAQKVLRGRTANKLYAAPDTGDFTLLLRNPGLSDDIAFRFDDKNWNEHPLTAGKFAEWLSRHPQDSEVINLFMDYETFGIYKNEESGIFNFLEALPQAVLAGEGTSFSTPSKTIQDYYPRDLYDAPASISWEDQSAACCFWSENARQNNTLKKIYGLENIVMQSGDERLRETWGRLQSADYIYYMADPGSRKHKYINPFNTPQEMYDCYTNIVTDLELRLITEQLHKHNMHYINQTYNVF